MQNDSFLEPELKQVKDACWTYLLPAISAFSVLTNSLNILVFSSRKIINKNPIYAYMLANSVINLIYSLICSFVFLMRCGNLCRFAGTYLANFYELYVYLYFTSVLGLFNIFIEIAIAIQRYLIITNKRILMHLSRSMILVGLFVVSIIYYLPYLQWRKIILANDATIDSGDGVQLHRQPSILEPNMYRIKQTEHEPIELFIAILSSSRGIFILVLLFLINLLTLIKFQHRLKKKEQIKNITNTNTHQQNQQIQQIQHQNNSSNRKEATAIAADDIIVLNETAANKLATTTAAATTHEVELLVGVGGNQNENRRAKKNLTRMVIIMSVLFFIGNLPHTIALMLLPLINPTKSNLTFLAFFIIFSNSLLFASHGACILVYYFFNKHYRVQLNAYFLYFVRMIAFRNLTRC